MNPVLQSSNSTVVPSDSPLFSGRRDSSGHFRCGHRSVGSAFLLSLELSFSAHSLFSVNTHMSVWVSVLPPLSFLISVFLLLGSYLAFGETSWCYNFFIKRDVGLGQIEKKKTPESD